MTRTALFIIAMIASPLIADGQTTHTPAFAAWQHWQFVAPIQMDDTSASNLVAVTVPITVTSHAATRWADLRVVDNDGRETPYVLHSRPGGSTTDWRAATLVEPSFVAGQYTQVVVDAGEQPRVHNSARLQVATSEDFVTWVEIAASDNARTWRVVRERAPIYHLLSTGIGESTIVIYPDTVSRYARFRLLDGSRRYRVGGVDLAARVTSSAELVSVGFTLEASQEPERSMWTSTAGVSQLPIAGVQFDTAQPAFLRFVVVESSDDATRWHRQAAGEIYRITERGQPRTSLGVHVPDTSAAHWRIIVYNRNDPPLADLSLVLQTVPRRVVFRREPGRSYRLAYANPRATPPQYEMARLTGISDLDAATVATLGDAQQNASYVDPAPWTERHPVVLWSALGLALAVLVGLAVRTLQTGEAQTSPASTDPPSSSSGTKA